jgi:glycerol transport system permease protein
MSIVYNLIILAVCWVFYTVMVNVGVERRGLGIPQATAAASADAIAPATTIARAA